MLFQMTSTGVHFSIHTQPPARVENVPRPVGANLKVSGAHSSRGVGYQNGPLQSIPCRRSGAFIQNSSKNLDTL